eukprot:TRINITY_DN2491_c0_g1_i4.p1 TRINITY_DN2491_c0_g1~~TRINITY_DN2491_c0_g1_i4.p1  ORF type:complete len:675 (+),score=86.27 TRINITY_DN2491_c0_g1_i4:166-2190(+)
MYHYVNKFITCLFLLQVLADFLNICCAPRKLQDSVTVPKRIYDINYNAVAPKEKTLSMQFSREYKLQIDISNIDQSYAALCVITKDDDINDTKEFLDYHFKIGIGRIYLFDTGSNNLHQLKIFEALSKYLSDGRLFYSYWNYGPARIGFNMQIDIYNKCAHSFAKNHVWLGFIDTDEFIVLRNPEKNFENNKKRSKNSYYDDSSKWNNFGDPYIADFSKKRINGEETTHIQQFLMYYEAYRAHIHRPIQIHAQKKKKKNNNNNKQGIKMGGKGGPLAFLNKKPWHPGNLRNLERVWQKEQAHEREQKRLEELRKQILEERQKEQLEQIAHDSGKYKREERLEWLYQGGVAARQEADERNQQQTLKDEQNQKAQQEIQVAAKVQEASLLPSFYAQDTPTSALETWQRLNNDPLFLIKKKEQEALQNIKKNPVTMMRLKEQVATENPQNSPEQSRKKSKKNRKHKKHKKESKSKKRKRSPSISTQDDEDDEQQKSPKRFQPTEQIQSGSRMQQEDPEKQQQRQQGYGLAETRDREYSRHQDTARQSERTRTMLHQAAKEHRKEQEEERMRYQQRHNKQQFKTGRLKQEEMEKRRSMMMSNANSVDKDRQRSIYNHDEREQRDGEQNDNQRSFNSSKFIQRTQREFYGSDRQQQGDSLSERVARRRHYSQRNHTDLG